MTLLLIVGGVLLVLFGGIAFIGAPYVPSKRRELRAVFRDLYPLSSTDVLVDIGSGDGVVLREAATYGARAIGYELNPILVAVSRWAARGNARIQTHMVNFWHADLPPDTTVCYVFGDSRDIAKIAQRIQQFSTRTQRTVSCISYGFELPHHTHTAQQGAHYLYQITPLQGS